MAAAAGVGGDGWTVRGGEGGGASVLHQPVDMMLSPVLTRRHLKHICNAQQGLLSVSVCYHLKTKYKTFSKGFRRVKFRSCRFLVPGEL